MLLYPSYRMSCSRSGRRKKGTANASHDRSLRSSVARLAPRHAMPCHAIPEWCCWLMISSCSSTSKEPKPKPRPSEPHCRCTEDSIFPAPMSKRRANLGRKPRRLSNKQKRKKGIPNIMFSELRTKIMLPSSLNTLAVHMPLPHSRNKEEKEKEEADRSFIRLGFLDKPWASLKERGGAQYARKDKVSESRVLFSKSCGRKGLAFPFQ
ncbi:hypothetical protein K491DRAFT_380559 [Lophiostoma macrostomum CBS 122681]|uniref:Uncharacterized protein n=1 Tax=Lophiostoma macrostomum CBS 122681 TaxID=1314788 RepID=A0A6A6TR80_9PLEO|nr:hypothetical protein K491DRAFT_380559 [Lophiostoma macrostomum CBS 122681]